MRSIRAWVVCIVVAGCLALVCSCSRKQEAKAWRERMRQVLPLVEECERRGFVGTLDYKKMEGSGQWYWAATYSTGKDEYGRSQPRTDPLPFTLKGKVLIWDCQAGEPDWGAMSWRTPDYWAAPTDEEVSFIVITRHYRKPDMFLDDVAVYQDYRRENGKKVGEPYTLDIAYDRACIVLWPEKAAYGMFVMEGDSVRGDVAPGDDRFLEATDSAWHYFVRTMFEDESAAEAP